MEELCGSAAAFYAINRASFEAAVVIEETS
jgi:hypothetical protein